MPRLKYAVKLNPSKHELALLSVDMSVSFIPMDAVSERGEIRPEARKLDSVNEGFTYFRNGDVVMAKITPCFENGKGAVIHDLVNNIGFGTTEFLVLRPGRLDSKYLYYLISSHRFRKYGEMEMRGSAGQKRVPEAYVANYVVDELDIDEQKKRANFLDKKTVLIDRAIEQKRKLIRLLKEKRTALINRAVTRGLDEDVELVDTGEEWIGKVPKGWKILKFKYLGKFISGGTPATEKLEYWDGNIPWISPKDMKSDEVIDSEDHITAAGLANTAGAIVPAGSLLLVYRSGILRHSIPTAINAVDAAVNQDIRAVLLKKNASAKYLHYLVQGKVDALLNIWSKNGATVESLEHGYVANTPMPLPSKEEQDAIVAYLDKATRLFDRIIVGVSRSIDLLTEYRTSLVSHAVTGKVEI